MWVSQGFDQWNEPREIKRIEVYPDSGEKYAFFEGSETGILCDQLEIPDSKTENKPDLANTSENPYNSKEAEESHVQSEIVHTSVFAERLQSHAQRAKILSDDGVLKDVASPNWKGYFLAAMISRLPKWVPLFDKEKNRRQAEVYKTLRSSQHRVSPLVSNRFFAMSRKDAIEAEIEGYNNGITEYKDSIARQIRDNTQISAPEKIEKMQRLDSLMETSKKQIESQYEAELIAIETIQDCYKKIPRWVGPLHYLIPPLLKKGQVYKHRLDAALLVLGDTSVSVISPYATDDDAKRSHEQVLLHYASLQRTKEKAIASALEKAQQEITELVS